MFAVFSGVVALPLLAIMHRRRHGGAVKHLQLGVDVVVVEWKLSGQNKPLNISKVGQRSTPR